MFFFFNDTATTEIYTLSLHDALPICNRSGNDAPTEGPATPLDTVSELSEIAPGITGAASIDRKSTRLNSSHSHISYAVFCLKKKAAQLQVHPVLKDIVALKLNPLPLS